VAETEAGRRVDVRESSDGESTLMIWTMTTTPVTTTTKK
jgi:hypothetical protein